MARTAIEKNGVSRSEHAYSSLRAAIHGGRFKPGDRMAEVELATMLGISRTPIRDALKRLESDGLLVAAPRRGLIVAELDQQQVSELYAVRDVLEGLAARLAAQHASPAEIAAMRDLLRRQERTRSGDTATLARLNRQFHDVIYRAARNRYLADLLNAFESSLTLLPGTTYSAAGRAVSALTEHTDMVRAIERHDAARAERLAREHIRAAEKIRVLMISGALDEATEGAARGTRAKRKAPGRS